MTLMLKIRVRRAGGRDKKHKLVFGGGDHLNNRKGHGKVLSTITFNGELKLRERFLFT